MHDPAGLYDACEKFIAWLDSRLVAAGRGDDARELRVDPDGLFWLGRLAPEDQVIELGLGDRGERIDPCSCGIRLKPAGTGPWSFDVEIGACLWQREGKSDDAVWHKTDRIVKNVRVTIPNATHGEYAFGDDELAAALAELDPTGARTASVRVELETNDGHPELTVTVVNRTPLPEKRTHKHDLNLYEVSLSVSGLSTEPFLLESLPDSFRYDRRVHAYGVNCGVVADGDRFTTVDTPTVEQPRPTYWSSASPQPDLTFRTLAREPIPPLDRLVEEMRAFGEVAWGDGELDRRRRDEHWSQEMFSEARAAAGEYWAEVERIAEGVAVLRNNTTANLAFRLMNEAIEHSAQGKYDGWRPFQVGFLLSNMQSVVEKTAETETADIVWFATGGGKTETYLGLLVMASILDRLNGKASGITAWSRFPLRMLSLQQTQRFADAMAGAELARRRAEISGDPFSVGFFVGRSATPNSIPEERTEDWHFDVEDDDLPATYQVLLRCPFCAEESIEMAFDRRYWHLEHRCSNDNCSWPERGLPFYIVDDEIYRHLPTVIVGTLDKAALIGMNAAMRGFVGPPLGCCSEEGHGFVYASRKSRPNGCLVPGCQGTKQPLEGARELFPPRFRLQDELHLLRDSLGAVDAHYEALLDNLQHELTGTRPKILASSATLEGYRKQVDVLYRRAGRVFPAQGPSASSGFWTSAGARAARRYVAVAPRGLTLEFAVDRILTELQRQVRRLGSERDTVCGEAGIDPRFADDLLSIYGVDVVYGNSLRDLDAATRSLDTQVPVAPLNSESLTGRTDFDEVRKILGRLERPEDDFDDRVHVVAASSMMSHGVDIDRLNVMVVLGVPLTTAEFIQTTARVGRRWPAIVFLLHKFARVRDASVYRSFGNFVLQGDRLVEPVPVTRRSRRVLERTLAGLEMARLLLVHEPRAGTALTTVKPVREYFKSVPIHDADEVKSLVDLLELHDDLDEPLRHDIERWVESFYANLMDPGGTFRFPRELCPWGQPMNSLRDVEEQAPVRD
jgi:hypothetical protein